MRSIGPGLCAAILATLVFAGTLGHGFVYDDAFILRSPMLGQPWNLIELFSDGFYAPHDRYTGVYRPLGQWSFVLNAVLARAVTGSFDRPVIFHAVNLLLHVVASLLVFLWVSRLPLPRWTAGTAAVLWAVHPVHAEVVSNIWNRYESLSAVFGLSFLIAHRAGRRIIAGFLYLIALWCKESAIAFLPLAVVVDALFPAGRRRFDLRSIILPSALLGTWFLLRAVALSHEEVPIPYVENPAAATSFIPRILTAGKVQGLYLRDQLIPLWLSTDHSLAQIEVVRSVLDVGFLGFLAIVVISAAVAWRFRRNRPEIALCVVGYALLFAPVSNFLVPIGTIMADRLAYLPSVFFCLLVAICLSAIPSRVTGILLGGIATILLSIASREQANLWKDELSLFQAQVRTAPKSAKSHSNLGDALRVRGRLREAVEEYQTSIAIYLTRPEPHMGLAQAYELLGEEPELLINTWADAIRYGTVGERPTRVRALALADLGRWEDLVRLRSKVASANPGHPLLIRLDRLLRAAQLLMSQPYGLQQNKSRADELFDRGDWIAAEDVYRRALHRRAIPAAEIPQTIMNLARCHDELSQPERARWYRNIAAAVEALDH